MPTKLKKERRTSDPNAQAFLNMAQEYHLAATKLFSIRRSAESPLYFLYTHTIELALKAFLRSHGLAAPHTHALRLLARRCQQLGLQVDLDLMNVIDLLESENEVHGFRYFVFASTSKPEMDYLRQAVDSLMTRVNEGLRPKLKEDAPEGAVIKFTVGKPVKK